MYALAHPVVPQAGLKPCLPTAAEKKAIADGLAFLNMTTPFWASVLYNAMKIVHTKDVPLAATDSHFIYVNVRGMLDAGWDFENIAFVLAHEVMHYLFGDLLMSAYWRAESQIICPDGTALPYIPHEMNIAMDLRINAVLIDGKVGRMPKGGWFDPAYSAKGMESCVDIYAKRFQNGAAPPPMGGGFDIHLEPTKEQLDADKANGRAIRGQVISAARMVAEAAGLGTLPGGLLTLIGELLEPKVSWQDHLKACMMRASGVPANDWSGLNKRMISRPEPWGRIGFARRSRYGCGTVVVGYDTSGSCVNEKTQTKFFSEMAGIVADLNPAELIVIWCDVKVQRVDNLDSPTDLNALRADINEAGGAPGGGGTDLRKIFDHIRDEAIEPDMLVVLTDGYTPFPGEPEYPVVWATIGTDKIPFGDIVKVE